MSLSQLPASAVSKYTFYVASTGERIEISRVGIKHNSVSENSANYGRWLVTKEPGLGTAKHLLTNGRWMHASMLNNVYKDEKRSESFYHASAEEAFYTAQESLQEKLTA